MEQLSEQRSFFNGVFIKKPEKVKWENRHQYSNIRLKRTWDRKLPLLLLDTENNCENGTSDLQLDTTDEFLDRMNVKILRCTNQGSLLTN